MSKFYGQINGGRGTATRTGHRNIRAAAQSYDGSVITELSYNDEGIIPMEEIESIMKKYGNYKRYEKRHKRFKSDNERVYKKNYTIEYIHCLEKNI